MSAEVIWSLFVSQKKPFRESGSDTSSHFRNETQSCLCASPWYTVCCVCVCVRESFPYVWPWILKCGFKMPGKKHLSPSASDRCHLCIVCVRHDCSRHFPLWLAFTQCNQCCSCLKRPLVQYLSNADHPDASTTLLLGPFRLCDKRQTVWWACVKPLDLLLCLTALALFWMSPLPCMALL